jgi:hypothetical protein
VPVKLIYPSLLRVRARHPLIESIVAIELRQTIKK